MATILIIDDDPALLAALSIAFEDAGHAVLTAADGAKGLAAIDEKRPEAVISDVNMPEIDGFALCRKVREGGNDVPLILLTSRDGEIDEALGLELGADDYVAKPCSTRVLLARIQSLLRRQALRVGGATREQPVVSGGGLELDPERLEARFRSQPVVVTVTEFRLLEILLRRPGVVHSRAKLLEMLRGEDTIVVERIIDTYVRRLRRKFEAIDPAFDGIETIVGAGYRWKAA